MNKNYRDNLERYLLAIYHANKLLSMKVITDTEHAKIDTNMARKYGLSSCSIYLPNTLLNKGLRGNMLHYKEVDYE